MKKTLETRRNESEERKEEISIFRVDSTCSLTKPSSRLHVLLPLFYLPSLHCDAPSQSSPAESIVRNACRPSHENLAPLTAWLYAAFALPSIPLRHRKKSVTSTSQALASPTMMLAPMNSFPLLDQPCKRNEVRVLTPGLMSGVPSSWSVKALCETNVFPTKTPPRSVPKVKKRRLVSVLMKI